MLSITVTQICNLSIKMSHSSKDCKLGKLKHLYKKVTKTDTKKFRPLLRIVSKVIEKVIHDKTLDYLTGNNILY